MSYESTAEPIKLGYLFDFVLPDGYPTEMRADLSQSFEIVFEQGLAQGIIDRPVEIVLREVEGLPKGTVKAVIDAYGELVDAGCLAVFGPSITDNCVPTKDAIEQRFNVPAISVTGSEEWLGEWTFSLSMGSMTDEPIFWADMLVKGGHTDVGALVEQSLVGETYLRNLRKACRAHVLWRAADCVLLCPGDSSCGLHSAARHVLRSIPGSGVLRLPVRRDVQRCARGREIRRAAPGVLHAACGLPSPLQLLRSAARRQLLPTLNVLWHRRRGSDRIGLARRQVQSGMSRWLAAHSANSLDAHRDM